MQLPVDPTETPQTTLVGQRVDALVVAYALDADPLRLEYLATHAAEAQARGAAVLEFPDERLAFELTKTQLLTRVVFGNLDLRAQWDEQAAGGWNLVVTPCATYLATHSLVETLELCRRVAGCFGLIAGERLRRVDLAADFAAFPLCEMGQEAIQTRRSKTGCFETEAKDVADAPDLDGYGAPIRTYRAADSSITGYVVSPGNTIMARLYDKTVELKHPGREHKAALEHEIWRRNGWDGEQQVTRVEFQLRGEVLDEIHLRDPNNLHEKLDSVWQYCTRWVRCIDLTTATRRKRCALLPAWELAQSVRFVHPDEPVVRHRVRGGATFENMFGTLISYMGSSGRLAQMFRGTVDAFIDSLEYGAVEELTNTVQRVFAEAAKAYVSQMLNKHGWREAAARAFAKMQAAHARFAESDGDYFDDQTIYDSTTVHAGRPIVLPSGETFYPVDGEQWIRYDNECALQAGGSFEQDAI
jgi:hypothetical protein